VTCANSFDHYRHQDLAVAETHRVLKPTGQLFLLPTARLGGGWRRRETQRPGLAAPCVMPQPR